MLDDVALATGDPAMLASATQQPRDHAGCRGFVYVMDDGALVPVPCAAFDPRLVTVTDDASYDHGLPPGLYDRRGRILRVYYVSSSDVYRTLGAFVNALQRVASQSTQHFARLCQGGTKAVAFCGRNEGVLVLGEPAAKCSTGGKTEEERGTGGLMKGTVTRVLSGGWYEVAYDHAVLEARVPRSRIHVGNNQGRGGAVVGTSTHNITEGSRVFVSPVQRPPQTPSQTPSQTQTRPPGLHCVSFVTTCPTTGEARFHTLALGKAHVAVAAIELDTPCPPSTHRALRQLFHAHWTASLETFRLGLPDTACHNTVLAARDRRILRSASTLVRRSSMLGRSRTLAQHHLLVAAFHCGTSVLRSTPQRRRGLVCFLRRVYDMVNTADGAPVTAFVDMLHCLVRVNPFARAVLPPAVTPALKDLLDAKVVIDTTTP
jgi:hypothetical protein